MTSSSTPPAGRVVRRSRTTETSGSGRRNVTPGARGTGSGCGPGHGHHVAGVTTLADERGEHVARGLLAGPHGLDGGVAGAAPDALVVHQRHRDRVVAVGGGAVGDRERGRHVAQRIGLDHGAGAHVGCDVGIAARLAPVGLDHIAGLALLLEHVGLLDHVLAGPHGLDERGGVGQTLARSVLQDDGEVVVDHLGAGVGEIDLDPLRIDPGAAGDVGQAVLAQEEPTLGDRGQPRGVDQAGGGDAGGAPGEAGRCGGGAGRAVVVGGDGHRHPATGEQQHGRSQRDPQPGTRLLGRAGGHGARPSLEPERGRPGCIAGGAVGVGLGGAVGRRPGGAGSIGGAGSGRGAVGVVDHLGHGFRPAAGRDERRRLRHRLRHRLGRRLGRPRLRRIPTPVTGLPVAWRREPGLHVPVGVGPAAGSGWYLAHRTGSLHLTRRSPCPAGWP